MSSPDAPVQLRIAASMFSSWMTIPTPSRSWSNAWRRPACPACLPVMAGEALQLLADGRQVKVVVSDLRMPELTGLEFAERLGRLGGGGRPEVVFVSGHAGFDDAVEAIRLGARDLLTKPVDGPRLVKAVKSGSGCPPGPRARGAGGWSGHRRGGCRGRRAQARRPQADALAAPDAQPAFPDPALFGSLLGDVARPVRWPSGRRRGDRHQPGGGVGRALTTALRRMDQLKAHGLIGGVPRTSRTSAVPSCG